MCNGYGNFRDEFTVVPGENAMRQNVATEAGTLLYSTAVTKALFPFTP